MRLIITAAVFILCHYLIVANPITGHKQVKFEDLPEDVKEKITRSKREVKECRTGNVGTGLCYGTYLEPCEPEDQVIVFYPPFKNIPVVIIGLNTFDMDHSTNSRISVIVENVSQSGFIVKFGTWGDSTLYSAIASWIACG